MTAAGVAIGTVLVLVGLALWIPQVVRAGRGAPVEIEWTCAGGLLVGVGVFFIVQAAAL